MSGRSNPPALVRVEQPEAMPAADLKHLDTSLVRGVVWTGAAKWSTQVVAWAATLIVARLLTPADYGLVSMAAVYLGVLTLLSEFGLGSSVVMMPDLTEEEIAQLNGLSVCLGVVGFALSCALAIPLGRFFGSPDLPRVLTVMSLSFIVTSVQSIPAALLQKELRFKTISIIDGTRSIALSGATVLFAILGFRYWTLVFGALVSAFLGTVLILTVRRHRLALPRLSALKHAIRLSCHLVFSRLAWYSYSNADFVVAGRLLGQRPLGIYTIAWNLANAPLEKVSTLIGSVTPACYSAVREDSDALRRYLLRPTEAIGLIIFPIMIGMSLVAPEAVLTVLGPKWQEVVPALQLLAGYACIRSIMPLVAQVLQATGDAGFVMWNGIISAVLLPLAFAVGSFWGIKGIAAAWVIAYPINAVPLYIRASRRIGMNHAAYARALWPGTNGTLLMAIGVIVVKMAFAGQFTTPIRLLIEILTGAVIYILAILVWHRDRINAFRRGFDLIRG